MALWLEGTLWVSIAMIALITFGYPIALALVVPFMRRTRHCADAEPTVTLVIAAHNEERCLAAKLENSLALDYPRERLEIIVASDGSSDRTHEIAESYADRGVILRAFPRMGKTSVQNHVARTATGDILVFSDANAAYRPNAIRKLVRNFADPAVACVSGQLVYEVQGQGAGDGEGSYWNYEKFMKRHESELSSLIGANGSIYAVRRADYIEIDSDLISDLVEPLALVRSGKRVVYEPEAISVEEASTSYSVEFRRKVRILTRSIKGLLHMRELLNPLRFGVFSLQLLVHKLLRYTVPYFLGLGFLSLAGLAAMGRYQLPFALAAVAVAAAILVGRWTQPRRSNVIFRICHLLYYYLVVNYALLPAWMNIVRGTRMTVWVPDRKGA